MSRALSSSELGNFLDHSKGLLNWEFSVYRKLQQQEVSQIKDLICQLYGLNLSDSDDATIYYTMSRDEQMIMLTPGYLEVHFSITFPSAVNMSGKELASYTPQHGRGVPIELPYLFEARVVQQNNGLYEVSLQKSNSITLHTDPDIVRQQRECFDSLNSFLELL